MTRRAPVAAVLLITALTLAAAPPARVFPLAAVQGDLRLGCEACVVVDLEGNEYLSVNEREALPNASTTKIATALVVVRAADVTDEVELSETAAAAPAGTAPLAAGERFSVEELLEAMLIPSSNQAAIALAEHVAGSEAAFVRQMNELAVELGATGSNFVTADGFDAPGHGATARDLAVLAGALLSDPLLARIVGTAGTTITSEDGRAVELVNRNGLLTGYRGALGIKTGMTSAAKEALVGAARRKGVTLIAVALRSDDALGDVTTMLDLGFSQISRERLGGSGEVVGHVMLGTGQTTAAVLGSDVRAVTRPGVVERSLRFAGPLVAPVTAGDVVGRMTFSLDGEELSAVDVVAADTVVADDVHLGTRLLGWLLDLGASVGGRP